jgi:mxaD protein
MDVVGEGTGAMRIARGNAGEDQAERHLYRYTLERGSIPVRDYRGELRIEAADASTSVVIWSAQFELAEDGDGRTVESVRRFLRAGTENLRRRFGETACVRQRN